MEVATARLVAAVAQTGMMTAAAVGVAAARLVHLFRFSCLASP